MWLEKGLDSTGERREGRRRIKSRDEGREGRGEREEARRENKIYIKKHTWSHRVHNDVVPRPLNGQSFRYIITVKRVERKKVSGTAVGK